MTFSVPSTKTGNILPLILRNLANEITDCLPAADFLRRFWSGPRPQMVHDLMVHDLTWSTTSEVVDDRWNNTWSTTSEVVDDRWNNRKKGP